MREKYRDIISIRVLGGDYPIFLSAQLPPDRPGHPGRNSGENLRMAARKPGPVPACDAVYLPRRCHAAGIRYCWRTIYHMRQAGTDQIFGNNASCDRVFPARQTGWFPLWRRYSIAKAEFSSWVEEVFVERRASSNLGEYILSRMLSVRYDDGF